VAAHLRAAGVPFRIFGEPLEMWREHMPKGMVLKSDAFASNLSAPDPYPLSQFCHETNQAYADIGFRTPLATQIEYGLEFQRRHVGPTEPARVVEISPDLHGHNLRLTTGESLYAQKVVVATGLYDLRVLPEPFASLPEDAVSHVSQHSDLSKLAGKRVVVVGGGQSAVETVALLHEQGVQAALVSRRPITWFAPETAPTASWQRSWKRIRKPNWGLGPGWKTYFWSEMPYAYPYFSRRFRGRYAYTTFGPAGSDWTHDRVVGVVPIHSPLHGVTYEGGEVRLTVGDDKQTLAADHLIAATGYKADVSRLPFLGPMLPLIRTIGGAPLLNQHFESISREGLYFVGYLSAVTFGPSMRFIYGTRFTATRLTRHIAPRFQSQSRKLLPEPA
jgi:cation diffusion facilitator CzcD-associated flavoprotein CzcO